MASDAITVPVGQTEARPWVDELHQWLTTVDHKRLGILYIVSSLLFLAVGGLEGMIIRITSMHGTTIFFFVANAVLFGGANYLVPLMIGARYISFPRLNACSFWFSFLGG